MKLKSSTLKQQRENAELELIIEEFGRAMRNANRNYIQSRNDFTINMTVAWYKYRRFCRSHP